MEYLKRLLEAESKYRQFGERDGSHRRVLVDVSREIIEAAKLGVAQDIFHAFDDEGHSFIIRAAVILDMRGLCVDRRDEWLLGFALGEIAAQIADGIAKVNRGERPDPS